MLPCIKESCLGIFSSTADQRFMIGEDIFLRTHFPITMKRFRPGGEGVAWAEDDLLQELTPTTGAGLSGNRTFVLYGAPGSGKSEMIRWLECNLSKLSRRPYILRISRTELDPVKILQKILGQFKGISLEESIYHHWEDLRKKPVTLANHLVWSALGKMLPSDDEIIPVSYRLRPIIESNLRLNFSGIDSPAELEGRTPELISLEDLEELTRQCSLNLGIDCGQLRYLMARELEQAVLGGYNFVETLKSISIELMGREKARPLLLIDDLVQSMNIYSTDLLDFFITMEEGNWDIVLGLTPASFETSRRGREILNRITTLDTFEDRLTKLWLTDEQGHDSYFIDTNNCHLFAEKYLLEYKRLGGFSCGGGCSLVQGCTLLQTGMSQSPGLSPFNQALLGRIYRSLPRGKGRARYFIAAIGDILRGMARGDLAGALEGYIRREISVDHPDPAVRLLGEAYAPGSARHKGSVSISGKALALLLGRPEGECGDIEAKLSDLSSPRPAAPGKMADTGDASLEVDASKAAVRDWLEGRPANKELLKGLRLGIAFLCRELAQPCSLIPPNTSRLSPQIRWDETVEGCKVPVVLECLDTFEGIRVPRALGHAAYSLNYAHLKRGRAKEACLASALRSEEAHLLYHAAQELRAHLRSRLEEELGIPVDELAYLLFMLLMEMGQGGSEVPAIIREVYPGEGKRYPDEIAGEQLFFPEDLAQIVRALFKDWLLLRENVYDAVRLVKFIKKYREADPILEVAKISPDRISSQFKVAEIDLNKFIARIQSVLNELAGSIRGESALQERGRLEDILEILQGLQHPGVHTEIQGLLSSSASSLGLPQPFVPDWQACQRLQSRIKRRLRPYLGRDGRTRTDTPISAHRLLLALGEINLEPEYVAMKELCRLVEKASSIIKGAPEELRAAAERAGVAGHLAICQDWGGDISQSRAGGRWSLESFSQLAGSAEEVAARRKYLRILETASMHMDHQLAEDTRAAAGTLEEILSLGLSPRFLEKIQVALQLCRDYDRSLERMLRWGECEGAWEESAAFLRDVHQKICGGKLREFLLGICQEWRSYLENLGQLAHCLGLDGGSLLELSEGAARELRGVSEESDAADIARSLYGAGSCLEGMPTPGQIESQAASGSKIYCAWILDMLLAPHPPEVSLSGVSLEDLSVFSQNFPALAGAVKLRMYLSLNK